MLSPAQEKLKELIFDFNAAVHKHREVKDTPEWKRVQAMLYDLGYAEGQSQGRSWVHTYTCLRRLYPHEDLRFMTYLQKRH